MFFGRSLYSRMTDSLTHLLHLNWLAHHTSYTRHRKLSLPLPSTLTNFYIYRTCKRTSFTTICASIFPGLRSATMQSLGEQVKCICCFDTNRYKTKVKFQHMFQSQSTMLISYTFIMPHNPCMFYIKRPFPLSITRSY